MAKLNDHIGRTLRSVVIILSTLVIGMVGMIVCCHVLAIAVEAEHEDSQLSWH